MIGSCQNIEHARLIVYKLLVGADFNFFLNTWRPAATASLDIKMSCSIKVGYKKKILETNRLDMWKIFHSS